MQHDPHRLAQRTGKMRDRGIDRDDEIEQRNQRSRISEVGEFVAVIDQIGRGSGFAESGGNLVDVADAHVRKD